MHSKNSILFWIGIFVLISSVLATMWAFVNNNFFMVITTSGFFLLGIILLVLAKFFDENTNEVSMEFRGLKFQKKENLNQPTSKNMEKGAVLKFEIEKPELYFDQDGSESCLRAKFNFCNTGDKIISVKKLYLKFKNTEYVASDFDAFKVEGGETIPKYFKFWLNKFTLKVDGEIISVDTFDKKHIEKIECWAYPEPKKQ